MSTRSLARRLVAYRESRALRAGETLHLPLARPQHALMLAFVRMGGESSPWAVSFGRPGGARATLAVPEPRDRTLVAQMLAQLAEPLLELLRGAAGASEVESLHQLWLPNDSHVEMLHFLAYRYVFARRAAPEILPALNQLGRAANLLFQEAQRPAQTAVMSATTVLREAYSFPADDLRQQHLGFLLPWFRPKGSGAERVRLASEAEQHSISTSLDPRIEKEELQGPLETWNELRRAGKAARELAPSRDAIQAVLARELERRLDLLESAIERLRSDPRRLNRGVAEFVRTTSIRLAHELPVVERGRHEAGGRERFVLSPDTDSHPQLAAARFFELEEAHDAWVSLLLHDDRELQADAIADGDAFRGVIESVGDEGTGRAHVPVWTVVTTTEGPLRLREGTKVCLAGCKKREARIRRLSNRSEGGRVFELVIEGGKRACEGDAEVWKPAHERSHEGREVTFVQTYPSEIHRRKKVSLWAQGKPGDWVHRVGRPATVVSDEDDA
jgi:hypothetical protein